MIFLPPNLDRVEWNSDDAKALKDIIGSDVFQKALLFVSAERPAILDGSDVNKSLVASGANKGFELFLESLYKLTYEQPKPDVVHESYPDLDDESRWAGVDAR